MLAVFNADLERLLHRKSSMPSWWAEVPWAEWTGRVLGSGKNAGIGPHSRETLLSAINNAEI